jgi:hypothetical protein
MKRRTIILYWLMLLVPALLIGAVAALFLCREQQRLNQQARAAALSSVQIVADNLKFAVVAAEESITEELTHLDGTNPSAALQAWEKSNPFIRNVFLWSSHAGLQLPPLSGSRTVEERLFAARYSALFAGRVPFERASAEDTDPTPQAIQQAQALPAINRTASPAQQKAAPNVAPDVQQSAWDYNKKNQGLPATSGRGGGDSERLDSMVLGGSVVPARLGEARQKHACLWH